ncbi:HAD family hydrolase [Clostridium cellulovorans]|uniref:HAD-superfamily hydrolase, subfamily IA, variant 1 n=1 Tax=Clostridium cellulovorans (strain ATCC 35296 / DSM 3052 / OCM 3 / 743B) TaxID=573061 RepID=D9ST35_CLOC7|nr:HAD family hydrolase [Clostridium cellulovorans]ADL50651.1 HAD-superfamily hydrolase, subfamily IA, variant 1 [Clostridium cellulovorans 743B]
MDNVKWLFWDIGGTLVNEEKCYIKRITDTVSRQREKQKKYSYDDIYQAMVQASVEYKQPYATALKSLGIEEFEPYPRELEALYDNSIGVLERLHKIYKMGIIANQSLGTSKRLTEYGLIKYFDIILASAEEGLEKPDISFYERALQKSKCNAINAVMIGDRLDNDIYPAKRIGMKTIWIKQGFGGMQIPKSKEYEPDYTIENLDELIELLG